MRACWIALMLLVGASAAPAEPLLEWGVNDLGDGWYGYTFAVVGNDGLEKSFFADVTFEGVDGACIGQVKALDLLDVDSQTDAALYDGIAQATYDASHDSYFLEPFVNVMALTESENFYHIEAGTASRYAEVGLAYICASGDVRFSGSISRCGSTFALDGLTADAQAGVWQTLAFPKPEPAPPPLPAPPPAEPLPTPEEPVPPPERLPAPPPVEPLPTPEEPAPPPEPVTAPPPEPLPAPPPVEPLPTPQEPAPPPVEPLLTPEPTLEPDPVPLPAPPPAEPLPIPEPTLEPDPTPLPEPPPVGPLPLPEPPLVEPLPTPAEPLPLPDPPVLDPIDFLPGDWIIWEPVGRSEAFDLSVEPVVFPGDWPGDLVVLRTDGFDDYLSGTRMSTTCVTGMHTFAVAGAFGNGLDGGFVTTPAPGAAAVLAVGGLCLLKRRRRSR